MPIKLQSLGGHEHTASPPGEDRRHGYKGYDVRISAAGRAAAGQACTTARHRTLGAYYGHMGRIIGTILGAILAIWGIFTAIGWFSAVLKTFVITGLIAAVVFIVVWLLAGRRRQD